CDLAETYVFGKQSLGPILCGHLMVAPLIPKLRGHFAEFLNNRLGEIVIPVKMPDTCDRTERPHGALL
ncbi:hypothetical protein, partial [Clostridioides difficile]|uniref:hypothetical protein n=1 Tax=Clostridioides difficile TaxID=1496 RepID=UPI001A9BFDEA